MPREEQKLLKLQRRVWELLAMKKGLILIAFQRTLRPWSGAADDDVWEPSSVTLFDSIVLMTFPMLS